MKRAFDPPHLGDGTRVLIERGWPRGLVKDQVKIDLWLKELAPTTALRRWFGHEHARWERFKQQYFVELDGKQASIEIVLRKAQVGRLTLLFLARDLEYNQATALKEYLILRAAD